MQPHQSGSVAVNRKRLLLSGALMVPPMAAIWFAVKAFAPVLPGMEDVAHRMILALACYGTAILFTLALMIEAVSHSRLFTPAIDPLAAQETESMKIDLRVLSNTVEQSILFAPALFGLAYLAKSGPEIRCVFAFTAVWIVARLTFWVSYQYDQSLRAAGLVGSAITLVVLVWNCMRFARLYFGTFGEIAVMALFSVAEVILISRAVRAGRL